MDATGAGVLRDFIQHWRRDGVRIILSGVREQPLDTLRQMGMGTESGVVTFAPSYAEALVMAGGEAPSASSDRRRVALATRTGRCRELFVRHGTLVRGCRPPLPESGPSEGQTWVDSRRWDLADNRTFDPRSIQCPKPDLPNVRDESIMLKKSILAADPEKSEP